MADRRTTRAERQARYRRRKREGLQIVPAEMPANVREQLVAEGWIGADDANDSQMLADALTDMADCWARGTLVMPVKPKRDNL